MKYSIEWSEAEKEWVATCDAYPHLSADGDTPIKALEEMIGVVKIGEEIIFEMDP